VEFLIEVCRPQEPKPEIFSPRGGIKCKIILGGFSPDNFLGLLIFSFDEFLRI
jgi:hypothetical protein